MKLSTFFKAMVVLTAFSLIYINLQMQIFDLAYQGKRRDKEVHRLVDENGNVTYSILTLKSANHLGVKLLNENSDMKFLDNSNIVHLETTRSIRSGQKTIPIKQEESKPNLLLSLFSLKSQAEAKPIE